MKFIPLHTKNATIVYKNALCSSATILVLVFIGLSVMVPVLLVSILSPYSGIAESRLLYEQPLVKFKHQFIFFGISEQKSQDNEPQCSEQTLIACSTMSNLNARLQPFGKYCEGHKYWTQDINHDGSIDHAYFQLKLDYLPGKLQYFDLMLFFEAELKQKCNLRPPALFAQRITLPTAMYHGRLMLKAELQLKQYTEFICPFPGRNIKTHFRHVELPMQANVNHTSALELSEFHMENLLNQLKINSAYFQLDLQETYVHVGEAYQQLEIELQIHVPQVPARYHLNVWERLGQFWLYFASFFGISFYIMNKLKDYLFGRHIIRAWEEIPWKKLY